MKRTVIFSLLGLAILGFGCNSSTKKEVKQASDAMTVEHMEHNDKLTACSHSSVIHWKGSKPTGEHTGTISLLQGGVFEVNNNELVGGKFVIDMNSIKNLDLEDAEMNVKLVGHLKSADFFMVDSFPTAEFLITKVEALNGDADFTHTIVGNLTLKGITKSISFKAKVWFEHENVYATSEEFAIDRTQWGVNYGSKSIFKELADKFINDQIVLKLEVKSMK